jgi:DNA-binding transcriptional MerR regulator
MVKTFTQKDMVEITGINRNTLQVWLREGLIIPSIKDAKGRGATRFYSATDLTLIKTISILSHYYFNRDVIKSLCDYLHGKWPFGIDSKSVTDSKLSPYVKEVFMNPFTKQKNTPVLLQMSDNAWLGIGSGKILTMPDNTNFFLVINLSKIMDDIRKKLEQ